MAVSREVDLTQRMDFKDSNKKLTSISLKDSTNDYKRYHRMRAPETTTSTISDELNLFDSELNATTTLNNIFNLVHSNIMYIEERICWRELQDDPYVFEQHRTHEEWFEREKNWNFPLGDKYDRQRAHYEQLREAEIQLADICECCGRKINYDNCLAHHYALCQKCVERLYNQTESVSLHL